MTEHVHEWVLGDIGTTRHVRVGYVCESPSCSEFLTVTQVGVRLNATEMLSAGRASLIAIYGKCDYNDSAALQDYADTLEGKP